MLIVCLSGLAKQNTTDTVSLVDASPKNKGVRITKVKVNLNQIKEFVEYSILDFYLLMLLMKLIKLGDHY